MFERKIFPILLVISFVMALGLSLHLLNPTSPAVSEQAENSPRPQTSLNKPSEKPIAQAVVEPKSVEPQAIISTGAVTLSAALQAVKDGKSSIISTIFNAEDLNAQLNELLALSENGEAWADFAIGQVAEMCGYLYETPETQLIAMFTENRLTVNPEQQSQMSQLLPIVIDASKRCKTMDGEQLKALGNSRDWFEKAAEANQASAFVTTGYSLISKRLREEVEMAPEVTKEELQDAFEIARDKAKVEFHSKMREHFVEDRVNPETLISMAEHLNLFYEDDHPYKSKEAWMLLACDQGYEEGCSQNSKMMSLFCMFDASCKSGGNFQQGIVWEQGQFRYDEYRRTADDLRQIFVTKDWEKLGF